MDVSTPNYEAAAWLAKQVEATVQEICPDVNGGIGECETEETEMLKWAVEADVESRG